jgi:hypothetical protein
VKAVGDFDFERETPSADVDVLSDFFQLDSPDRMTEFEKDVSQDKPVDLIEEDTSFDISTYKPNMLGREWIISETDLAWISTGCYILGTGGGGSPYSHMLRLREIMRNGGVVRVISPDDLRVMMHW